MASAATPSPNQRSEATAKTPAADTAFARPSWWEEILALALVGLIIAGTAYPCLSPTICRGDFGDLQLASWKLGIAHPPGYPLYCALLHPLTWLPGLDPAYAISVGCLLLGTLALVICVRLQIRLGISPWVAATTVLGLGLYQRVQLTLVAPEVYGPTLLFLALAVYLTVCVMHGGQRRTLCGAAMCYAVAVISRPPVVLTLPFVVIALWLASKRAPILRRARTWFFLVVVAAAPVLLSIGYILLRDRPSAAYNYIEDFNQERGVLPDADSGLAGRLHRLVWLMSGRQFNEYLGVPLRDLPKKVYWLRGEIAPHGVVSFIVLLAIAGVGASAIFRKSPGAGWLLCGMLVQPVVYAMTYRVHGQAADLLPLLFALTALVGAGLTRCLSWVGPKATRIVGVGAMVLAASLVLKEQRLCRPRSVDGSEIVEAIDMSTMPEGSIIVTEWDTAAPMRYAKLITSRADVMVLTVHPNGWKHVPERFPGRAIYVTHVLDDLKPRYDLVPYRNLWRLSDRAARESLPASERQ
jgi:hypothetical protein